MFVSKTKVGKTTEGSNPPLSSDVLEACKSQALPCKLGSPVKNKVIEESLFSQKTMLLGKGAG